MERPSNTDASVCIPRMLPWRDWDEWHAVKALLFSPEPYLRCQGVQHVAVWRSRERIPHAVETTSQLVEVRLNDGGPGGWDVACARRSEEELRLVYSTVVVRAVNGLTGNEQKTAHAAPVSSLAREIGLPTWLVDIRHEAAHKQLPGLVILRLAADFLMDYLWRRYWAPQAEHLDFVWGAFDQLICRYKVTSEIDTSFPRKLLEEGSASSLPVFMDIRTARHSTIVTPSPLSTPSPAEAAVAYPSPARKKRRHAVSDHPTHSAHKIAIDPASPGAVAEMAAREMACSVTPTALSWALLSLLADGGVGTKRSGVVCGEHNTGSGRRQGHLLPRSRDRYPMPGTPGVDDVQVGHRLTTRWAALLDIFHVRWQGFGAALLVRLVEALLGNASREFLATLAPPTNETDAGPAEATSSTGASRGQGGDERDGIAASCTASKNGTIVGLERQALFFGLWVRHLLSNRWHMRSGDANIKEMLRTSAVQAGLSPDVYDQPEVMWGDEQRTWLDRTAAPEVLRIAFFPVQELLARCRMSIATLGAIPGSAKTRNERSEAKTRTENGGENDSHWANAGLEAVSCALEKALGENGNTDFADKGRPDAAELPGRNNRSAFAQGCRRDTAGEGSGAEAPLSNLYPYSQLGRDVNCAVSIGEPKVASSTMCAQTGVGNEKELRGGCECDGGQLLASSGEVSGSWTGNMMELDALERLLGGAAGLAPSDYPSIPTKPTISYRRVGAVSDGGTENAVTCSHGIMGNGRMEEGEFNAGCLTEEEGAAHVGEDGAWDLVKKWTPCAIGTLPGWSGAQLQLFR